MSHHDFHMLAAFEGKKKAAIEEYARLHKKLYRLNPEERMMDMSCRIDDIKFKRRKVYAMITLRPLTHIYEIYDAKNHTWLVYDLISSFKHRKWIEYVDSWAIEDMGTDKQTGDKIEVEPHIHILVKFSNLYSPKQIASMIIRGRWGKYFSRSEMIDVTKYGENEFSKKKAYIKKFSDRTLRCNEKLQVYKKEKMKKKSSKKT